MIKRIKSIVFWLVGIAIVILFLVCLPNKLFDVPYSEVWYTPDGDLLGAKTASDQQWRFPEINRVPDKYKASILAFEDKRFYSHAGVDLLAVIRAMYSNIKEERIVSGGSTLTMQVMRMSNGNVRRTYFQKLKEMFQALRLELQYSKEEILNIHTSHAPFGGNVVGLEAASWRYFGKNPHRLTWAESATLAVLPNSPALIHPGKNSEKLLKKRNKLLDKLYVEGRIDNISHQLAIKEALPDKPKELPYLVPHLLGKADYHQVVSSIDKTIQETLLQISTTHHNINQRDGIENHAILVIENTTGRVLSYIGNTQGKGNENQVDMIIARRSSGSILKPFLYAGMLEEGKITPDQLMADVPVFFNGFSPQNYNKTYHGAISASDALTRSLNVPAVNMLQSYGIDAFLGLLRKLGITTLSKGSDHYGLSLVLGGGEVSLWELSLAYSMLAQKLLIYENRIPRYIKPYINASLKKKDVMKIPLGVDVIYETFEAMKKVKRPGIDGQWEEFESGIPMAWKTGTSYGHRDAWAVGVNRDYTIGVWVGNSDGEGRSSLIGSQKAGSILFDVVNNLPSTHDWFMKPIDEYREHTICTISGFIASSHCVARKVVYVPHNSVNAPMCPYHKTIYINQNGKRTFKQCDDKAMPVSWFSLPPMLAHYYKRDHLDYVELPAIKIGCADEIQQRIALSYPHNGQEIYLPNDIGGDRMKVVFNAEHILEGENIYWHVDDEFIAKTNYFHTIEVDLEAGEHRLRLLDSSGNQVIREFKIVGN